MDEQEFLDILRKSLVNKIPESEIDNNINYYNNYISSSNTQGTTKEERLTELGDPRLIARTIVDAYKMSKNSIHSPYRNQNTTEYEDSSYSDEKENNHNNQGRAWNVKFHSTNMPWYQKIIGVLILVLIFIIVIIIGGVLLNVFFAIGVPILIILFIISFISKMLR
jgi:uncharacterized membrane protein